MQTISSIPYIFQSTSSFSVTTASPPSLSELNEATKLKIHELIRNKIDLPYWRELEEKECNDILKTLYNYADFEEKKILKAHGIEPISCTFQSTPSAIHQIEKLIANFGAFSNTIDWIDEARTKKGVLNFGLGSRYNLMDSEYFSQKFDSRIAGWLSEWLKTSPKEVASLKFWDLTQIKQLAEALKENTIITSLELSNTHINEEDAKSLSEAFKANSTLNTFKIFSDNISYKSLKILCDAFNKNITLTTLKLYFKEIEAEGVKILCDTFEQNITLTTLNLTVYSFDEEDIKAFSEALKKNTTLKTLSFSNYYDIYGNKVGITKKTVDCFIEMLKQNRTLTKLDIPLNNSYQKIIIENRLNFNQHLPQRIREASTALRLLAGASTYKDFFLPEDIIVNHLVPIIANVDEKTLINLTNVVHSSAYALPTNEEFLKSLITWMKSFYSRIPGE